MSLASPSKNSLSLCLLDEAHRGRPALLDLVLLVQVARGRQHDAVGVAHRVVQRIVQRERRPHIVARREAAVDMAGADAQLQHHRRVRGFRQLEAFLHGFDDRRQVGTRVEEPDLRLHRERMAALLHDRGAFAVVLADDDERAAGDPARRQVGEGIGRHVGADGGLERGGPAQRIVDRGSERRGRRRLVRARLEPHAQVLQGCRWRPPARRRGARSGRPGSRRHTTRRTAAAPW